MLEAKMRLKTFLCFTAAYVAVISVFIRCFT